jgi:hypothetical protein
VSAPPSLIATTRDAHVIHALLGSGGMANVYRGVDQIAIFGIFLGCWHEPCTAIRSCWRSPAKMASAPFRTIRCDHPMHDCARSA